MGIGYEPYSEEFVDGLITEFRIDADKALRLRTLLNDAARRWLEDDGTPLDDLNVGEFSKTFYQLKAARDALRTLDHNALQKLANVQDYLTQPDEFPRLLSGDESWDDSKLYIWPSHPDDPDPRDPIAPTDVADMIDTVMDVVAFGTSRFVPKRGPKQDRRLENWMRDARRAWCASTGRKFTRDFDPANAPLSDAAQFCVRVYAVLSPMTPPSRINSTMKRLISQRM